MEKLQPLPYIPETETDVADLYVELPKEALAPVAVWFDKIAHAIDRQALRHDYIDQTGAAAKARVRDAQTLHAVVAFLARQGLSCDEIERQTASLGVHPEIVRYLVKRHGPTPRAIEKAARDREIVTLASKGWSNAQIAAGLGIHKCTVGRIIKRQRRKDVC